MHEALDGCTTVVAVPVAWGEMDALQHVNNIVYFRYFESSRLVYLEKAGLSALLARGIGPVLAEIRCRFKAPVTYPDTLDVGTRLGSIEGDRIHVDHVIVSRKLGRVVAEGRASMALIDVSTQKKVPIPPEFAEALGTPELDG